MTFFAFFSPHFFAFSFALRFGHFSTEILGNLENHDMNSVKEGLSAMSRLYNDMKHNIT